MQFPLVLFDLDGTLVDSLPDIADALNTVLRAAGRQTVPLGTVRDLVGEGIVRLVEKALSLEPEAPLANAVALAAQLREHYREHPCVHSRLYPEILETLTALRARGHRLAVLTNKPGDVARALIDALGITTSFDAIVGDADGYPRKPDPTAARALMTHFQVTPEATLMVGDGLPDLAVAKAASCASAAALWGYTEPKTLLAEKPTHALQTPAQLVTLIG